MVSRFLKKSFSALLKQQTNILSAAFIIMTMVILSQLLGLVRQRLLTAFFGASNTVGIYLYSTNLPNLIFQLVIASALATAFIPVFSEYLAKGKDKEGHVFASNLLCLGLSVFFLLSLILIIFANFFCHILYPGFSSSDIGLMANLTRIIVVGQLFFIVGSFFAAVLQSYNHFFISSFSLALYNLGIIIGIVFLSPFIGIYSGAVGVVIGSLLFVLMELPFIFKTGFRFTFSLAIPEKALKDIFHLMWPRTLSIAVFQVSILLTGTLVSFLVNPGRNYVIFDFAQTLAFAPVNLFGTSIAQAAFPILARQKDSIIDFKATFVTSFNQMLYLVLPFSVLFLVLRIPIVRLVYGSATFDWMATVDTGRTLMFLSLSIFSQALIALVSRAFYALHDTMTPLWVSLVTTVIMVVIGAVGIFAFHLPVMVIAFAYTVSSILQLLILMVVLDRKTGGFITRPFVMGMSKIFVATFITAFALYIPLKLLDQLVFDTTRTINLLMLTGISSFIGLVLYLFLTWLFAVNEARTYLVMLRKIGNWREILGKSDEPIESPSIG